MSVDNNAYGFKGMSGPQFFPLLRRELENGKSAFGYLKYSPVNTSFTSISFSNQEFAFGGGWMTPIKGVRSLSLNLDVATIGLKIKNVEISNTSISLSAGYGF